MHEGGVGGSIGSNHRSVIHHVYGWEEAGREDKEAPPYTPDCPGVGLSGCFAGCSVVKVREVTPFLFTSLFYFLILQCQLFLTIRSCSLAAG